VLCLCVCGVRVVCVCGVLCLCVCGVRVVCVWCVLCVCVCVYVQLPLFQLFITLTITFHYSSKFQTQNKF
jgi:hypothetical protein